MSKSIFLNCKRISINVLMQQVRELGWTVQQGGDLWLELLYDPEMDPRSKEILFKMDPSRIQCFHDGEPCNPSEMVTGDRYKVKCEAVSYTPDGEKVGYVTEVDPETGDTKLAALSSDYYTTEGTDLEKESLQPRTTAVLEEALKRAKSQTGAEDALNIFKQKAQEAGNGMEIAPSIFENTPSGGFYSKGRIRRRRQAV